MVNIVSTPHILVFFLPCYVVLKGCSKGRSLRVIDKMIVAKRFFWQAYHDQVVILYIPFTCILSFIILSYKGM